MRCCIGEIVFFGEAWTRMDLWKGYVHLHTDITPPIHLHTEAAIFQNFYVSDKSKEQFKRSTFCKI
jgi:hypothetical protein